MNTGFPELTESFLAGQDIFYTQFNDIEFYVEDINQENLYFEILKKMFSDIKFEKIFPLGGKVNVINNAKGEVGNRRKVYLLDLDFDEILGLKENIENVFYLKRYSLENYLLEKEAFINIVIEEKPQLKFLDIENRLQFDDLVFECTELLSELIPYYIVVQSKKLGIKNVDYDTVYFCDLTVTPSCLRPTTFESYKTEIETKLLSIDNTLILSDELERFKGLFSDTESRLKHIPGKYILNFIRCKIEYLFRITKLELESLTFRLARYSALQSLDFLKIEISNYILN